MQGTLYVAEQRRLHESFSFAQLIRQALADSATRHEALPSGLAFAYDPMREIQANNTNRAIFIKILRSPFNMAKLLSQTVSISQILVEIFAALGSGRKNNRAMPINHPPIVSALDRQGVDEVNNVE
jgi:hypothetical protein